VPECDFIVVGVGCVLAAGITEDPCITEPEWRVHGVAGLRVVGASVMPVISNAHPNATVLAVAEKAAAMMHCQASLSNTA
jgi:choline dehydrogenase-like flavoprotein